MTPRTVLMKTGLKPLNTTRPVNTAHPKTTVYRARPMSCFSKLAQSTVKRPYQSRTTLTNKNSNQKVNNDKEKVYTTKPKAVNTARPTSAVVNVVRANQVNAVKASACWVWRPTKLNSASITFKRQNYIDARGRSKHMTGNMSYLSDFKELLVKELLKLNSVLFTDSACFVLSPDFKLPDESQVLLNVPRKNNMYSVDMKNIVPKESLTCLVAKATLDESMLWHKRLGKATQSPLCNNGTEFKNRVMNEFCEKKGIKREFSGARTPHQNGVAERRNRTLIEAAKTMLADSKLPTTFWAEAVNTACYVQNRVIIVKPHNKTPYELFKGKTPAPSFMRPFGCHVTILNTLFDDGFFVGYLLTSKAFRVYNIRTRKVEENLHIRFLENKPIVTSDGPKWLFDIDSLTKSINYVPVVADTNSNDFAGSEESNDAGHTSKETEFSQDYIVMPLWKHGSMFDSSLKNSSDDEPQPYSNAKKKDDEGVSKASGFSD
ncbi:ribonuclease H-like domain-containing protein [Tanacetum coccineum]